jgi:hypothetical protein
MGFESADAAQVISTHGDRSREGRTPTGHKPLSDERAARESVDHSSIRSNYLVGAND